MSERSPLGRVGTGALVLFVATIAGAAVVDSVRTWWSDDDRSPGTPAPRAPELPLADRAAFAARLRSDGVTGVLYVVDRRCRLHALHLPALAAAPAPRGGGCRALVSPASAPPGWSLWPRTTPLAAHCERGRVVVSAPIAPALPMIGGCAPAWKPDGSLTYVRGGAIVQFPRTGRALVLRTRRELAAAVGRVAVAPVGRAWRADAVAWLGQNRFALAASAGARSILVVVDGARVVSAARQIASPVQELRASPRGTYVAVRVGARLRVYDARRHRLPRVRALGAPTAVAWSSDERWVAQSNGRTVTLDGRGDRVVLPIVADDVAWTSVLGR